MPLLRLPDDMFSDFSHSHKIHPRREASAQSLISDLKWMFALGSSVSLSSVFWRDNPYIDVCGSMMIYVDRTL